MYVLKSNRRKESEKSEKEWADVRDSEICVGVLILKVGGFYINF